MKFRSLSFLGFGLSLFPFFSASAVSIDSGLIQKHAYDTDYFSIEFSDLILDQADENENGLPDIVDVVAEAAEYSRRVVIDELHYQDPMEGYDRKIIVVLDDSGEYLRPGAMGITSLLSNGDPFVSIDPWMSGSDLQVTMGHEYFHCVQFGYDDDFAFVDQGANWAEATAVWVEDEEYDENNDYVNYLGEYFDYVDYSVFASIVPSGTLYQYGLAIWPRFLSEYFDTGVIQEIWETYFDSSDDYEDDRKLYNAVKDVVEANGHDLRSVYRDFTLWNLDLSEYVEGDSYPFVYTLGADVSDDYQEIEHDYAPALFGTNYLYFENTDESASFYFHLLKPDGVSFAVTLIPYADGSVDLSKKQAVILDRDEAMDEVLELDGLKRMEGVYVVVSALDSSFSGDHLVDFDEGYLYNFFAQYGVADRDLSDIIPNSSADMSTTSTDSTNMDTTTTDAKEGSAGSETVLTTDNLTLNVVNYDEDSVSFSWHRLNEVDITGYELRYGTKSGDYSETISIVHPYLTAATVGGLKEGTKYYFELVGLNAKGHAVGSPSAELSLTPAQWIFTDLSYVDSHYDAIASLVDLGVFSGYSNGSFRPNDTINRAELLKILVEGRGLNPEAGAYQNCFTDVKTEWYAKYVCYAKAQGWVSGYSDGSFRPSNPVNRVEGLKILFQVYQAGLQDGPANGALSYSDLSQTAWYAGYVAQASELGILEEAPGQTFEPTSSRTRGEMAEELYRYLVVEVLLKD